MTCREPYCANSGIPRGCYEAVMGFLCDDCEARAEREDREKEFCPVCGDYRREHEVFPCVEAEEVAAPAEVAA